MLLGRIDLKAYDVIDSNNLEQDLSEKPGPTFSHPALGPADFFPSAQGPAARVVMAGDGMGGGLAKANSRRIEFICFCGPWPVYQGGWQAGELGHPAFDIIA